MKKMFFILMCCALASPSFAEKIVYFKDKKTHKMGVKTQSGKIIIPAQYSYLMIGIGGTELGKPIKDRYIELIGSQRQKKCDKPHSPTYAAGDVFDRKGKYLYSPQWFDNGMDDFEEGLRRFVENCKIGFVNMKHQKVIPAQYDFVSAFYKGYALVYAGNWRRKYASSGDYIGIEKGDDDAFTYVIDKKGKRISGSLKPQSHTDIQIGGKYYPVQY